MYESNLDFVQKVASEKKIRPPAKSKHKGKKKRILKKSGINERGLVIFKRVLRQFK